MVSETHDSRTHVPVAECLVVELSLPYFKVGRATLGENVSLTLPVTHNRQGLISVTVEYQRMQADTMHK